MKVEFLCNPDGFLIVPPFQAHSVVLEITFYATPDEYVLIHSILCMMLLDADHFC